MGVARTGIQVRAREPWNPLHVLARPGETFAFSCTGVWSDAGIASGPAGQPGVGLQRLAGWLRRKPDAPWFAVIGALGRDSTTLFTIGEACEWTNNTGREAPLFVFANDVRLFYGNNSGGVLLDLRRTG